ncbi:MAG: gliding motility lipoprotein GldH [Bacteroidota bacterium]
MQKVILSIIIILFLAGCNSNTTFKEYKKFDDLSWNRFDILDFEFPVQKNDELDFYLALRHHTDFPYSYIDVNITITTPDGEIRSREYRYRLKNTSLKWKGDGMGDLWDIEFPIRRELLFNKSGICKVQIENKMHRVETPGIIEVGLIVKRSSDKKE